MCDNMLQSIFIVVHGIVLFCRSHFSVICMKNVVFFGLSEVHLYNLYCKYI